MTNYVCNIPDCPRTTGGCPWCDPPGTNIDIFGEQHRLERMLKERDAEIEWLRAALKRMDYEYQSDSLLLQGAAGLFLATVITALLIVPASCMAR
jgi:hypothetical protein